MIPLLLAAFLDSYSFVDIEAVRAVGAPSSFVKTARIPANVRSENCESLIAGAGMGGIGAALRAADRGHQICLAEEATWIGGQATAAGVSALDENKFIEVTYANGEKEILYFKDFASGALIEGIVSRAKKYAVKRAIAQEGRGLRSDVLIRSIREEFIEHEDLPNTTNPDDWA